MDANFKLKQKERGFSDPPLANGLAYMVSNGALQAHLAECVAKSLTSEVLFYFYVLCPFLTRFIPDKYLRIKVSCGQSGTHKVF